jgi:DNA-binding response OmpR family regulator
MARVVIIEDDEGVVDLISTILSRDGHEVLVAHSASHGIDLVSRLCDASSAPVLVVTDIFMPGLDGLEVTSQIKREHPEVAVIAISGGGDAGERGYLVAAREFGADFTLPKPFRPRELRAAVDELLRA